MTMHARADLANAVVLINLPGGNTKRLLIRNTLYDRALSLRHLTAWKRRRFGKRRESLFMPLWKHRLEVPQGNDFDIECKIVAYENEIGVRKMLKALHIRPKIQS
uniref:Tnp_DDE_dom domain-containing protein n=1 Tax=Haemonchus contortus TaxID=6289 RepID=A0A7I4YIW6_HAECO